MDIHSVLTRTQLLLLLMLLSHRFAASDDYEMGPRIVGGQATTIANLKFLVNLRINGIFVCGGTLVSSTHVVSAAHCVKGEITSTFTVVGGATYLTDTGVRSAVSKIYIPKAYRTSTMNMDVAVLKLASPMTGANIAPIGLCNSSLKVGKMVQVSGWGVTSEKEKNSPNRVRTVQVPLIAKSTCKEKYSGRATITSNMFCASVPGKSDSCSGDSGGPAIYEGRLCGIVSWGIGCARSQYPGVYTYVQEVAPFIRKAMAK